MSFVHPAFLWVAGAAAAGVVALHFLVTTQPRPVLFPPVRFVPDAPVRSTAITVRFSDLLLMLLRVAAILLVGAAFAQPRLAAGRMRVARIAAVDVSPAVARTTAWRDSVKQVTRGAAVVVAFDSMARVIGAGTLDSLLAAPPTASRAASAPMPGRLSVGLVAALRAASRLRDEADSVELVLVAPLVAGSRDAATLPLRALWPGGIRLVRPDVATPADTSHPRVVLQWADSARSPSWTARTHPDTAAGVHTAVATLIAPFERRWRWSATADPSSAAFVSGRWLDGEPAMVERIANGVCTRSVGFSLPTEGDAILRPEFVRFVTALAGPCGPQGSLDPLSSETRSTIAGTDGPVASSAIRPRRVAVTPLVPWLLAGALALLLLELAARRIFGSGRRAVA